MYDYAIFVQARLGSKRFPNKVLHNLGGKRVLDHVLDACHATSIKTFLLVPESDQIEFKNRFNVDIYAGSESDVLARFAGCASANDIRNIIRITSDCPCIRAEQIKKLVEIHQSVGGFVTNVQYDVNSYESMTMTPDGFDIEIFTRELLDSAHKNVSDQKDKEHVTSWMRRNFDVQVPKLALALSGKYSIDTPEDLRRIELLFDLLQSTKTVTIENL